MVTTMENEFKTWMIDNYSQFEGERWLSFKVDDDKIEEGQ
jgi:hypothetical protein